MIQINKNTLKTEISWFDKVLLSNKVLLSIFFYFIYISAGQIGLSLATHFHQVSPIWPASGVAIWILATFGFEFIVPIALGAFTINFLTSHEWLSSLIIMLGNSLEAFIGCLLYQKLRDKKNNYINSANFSFLGIIVAGLVAPVISALLGTLSVFNFKLPLPESGVDVLFTWWTGDMLGILSLLPLLNSLFLCQNIKKEIVNIRFFPIVILTGFSTYFIYQLYSNETIAPLFFFSYILIWASIYFFKEIQSQIFIGFLSFIFLYFSFHQPPLFPGRSFNENLIHIQYVIATFIIVHLVFNEINKVKSRNLISIVLVGGWILCSGLYFSLKKSDIENKKTLLELKIKETESLIKDRLNTYIDSLNSSKSFIAANNILNQNLLKGDSFKLYVENLNITSKYPGINGIGFIYYLKNEEEKYFIKKIQKENPTFKIKKVPGIETVNGKKDQFIIIYVYPFETNNPAFGLDIGSEQNRRIAAEYSRDKGLPVITHSIQLVQDSVKRPGFLLYIPFYDYKSMDSQTHTPKFIGWVYAPFVTELFINEALTTMKDRIPFSIYEGNQLIYEDTTLLNKNFSEKNSDFNLYKKTQIILAERELTILWKKPLFTLSNYNENLLWVAIVGSLICLLLSIVVFSFENTGRQAQEIADRQTQLFLIEKDKALSASKVKSEFLANMSHEIRTPLNGIVGMINLLLHSKLEKDDLDKVKIIHQSCDVLMNLIDDVLNFSKLEANKIELKFEACNIKNIANDIASLFKAKASEKGITIEVIFNVGNSEEWVSSDPFRLKQILSNLVGNALKFTQKGKIQIILESKNENNNYLKTFYRVEVKDNGIGIKKELQQNLFKSFSQVDASSTKQFGGTGLGLSISKGLVELLGGHIWVESNYGTGSSFIFNFYAEQTIPPLNKINSELGSSYLTSNSNSAQSETQKVITKILVVDDNNINQVVAQMTLKKLGYECDIASTGKDAIEMYTQNHYDLILMDCYMPEMDGFETTIKIRKLSKSIHSPRIVAVTASIMKEDHEKCFQAGMDAVIVKPITSDAIKKEAMLIDTNRNNNSGTRQTLINHKDLNLYFKDEDDIFIATVNIFNSHHKQYLLNIENSILQKDFNAINKNAHALKSMVSSFFAKPLKENLKTLEEESKLNVDTNFIGKFYVIQNQVYQLATELNELKIQKESA